MVRLFEPHAKSLVFLEPSEELLDTFAEFVDGLVVLDFDFTVLASWNHRLVILRPERIAKRIGIIAHIEHDVAVKYIGEKLVGDSNIGGISSG